MANFSLSIIICTFNRSEILELCLKKLLEQVPTDGTVEVIVVNNNSTDDTEKVVTSLQKTHTPLRYILETTQGLSHARNRGAAVARGAYIGYIDDDAMIGPAFVDSVFATFKNYDFDVLGGKVLPWFKYGEPRWFPANFEVNFPKENTLGPTEQWGEIWGGVVFFKSKIFEEVGGFPTEFGMIGNKMEYGEDTVFIKKLYNADYKMGFNPAIIIYHLVRKEKLHLKWHIITSYKRGKIYAYTFDKERVLKLVLQLPIELLINLFKEVKPLLTLKTYYWENYILNVTQPFANRVGRLVSSINK